MSDITSSEPAAEPTTGSAASDASTTTDSTASTDTSAPAEVAPTPVTGSEDVPGITPADPSTTAGPSRTGTQGQGVNADGSNPPSGQPAVSSVPVDANPDGTVPTAVQDDPDESDVYPDDEALAVDELGGYDLYAVNKLVELGRAGDAKAIEMLGEIAKSTSKANAEGATRVDTSAATPSDVVNQGTEPAETASPDSTGYPAGGITS